MMKHDATLSNSAAAQAESNADFHFELPPQQIQISPERINEEIEKRVTQRTAELLHAKTEAEQALRAKSEYLEHLSHELRTPLNGILGFAQLLMFNSTHALDEEQAGYVHEIMHSGNGLLALINALLDLSSIENGKLDMVPEPIAIAQLVRESVAHMQALAGKKNIGINLRLVGDYVINVDPQRMRQILLHLLSNAVRYNNKGGSISIRCTSVSAGRVLIEVEDSGCGISEQAIPRLFQLFQKRTSSEECMYSEKPPSSAGGSSGSGIGLLLVKRLTEAMGGNIGVHSIVGTGSNFWLEFPLAADMEPLPDLSALKTEGSSLLCVLYIEDNPASVRLVQESISSRLGIKLLHAPTAELGLEISLNRRPDIILLDINLDGFEALALLKKNPLTCRIPVIAITANGMERDIKRGLDAGFADYLTKPVDIIQLIILLGKFQERKKVSAQQM
jgi:signal transduction histidine kinase/ActR/RegA family two-component response regulator